MRKTVISNYIGKKGGGPLYAYEMARGLIENDYAVIAILPENIENIDLWNTLDGCEVITVRGYSDSYISLLAAACRLLLFEKAKIRRACRNKEIECVYIPMVQPFSMLINACIKSKRRIVTIHDPKPHRGSSGLYAAICKKTAEQADDVIILSEKFKEFTMDYYGKTADQVHVIPHGIFDKYKHVYNPKCKFEYDPNKINFLFFGRITEYKGLSILAQAYRKLCDEFSNVALTIVGNGDFSPYRSQFDSLSNVTVVNRWIKDEEVYGYFNSPSVVTVLPYIEATQSGVIPVAMACESFVISSDCGGLSEQIENGITGQLVSTGDVEALYNAMRQVVINGVNTDIIKNAKAYVENLSWDKLAKKLIDIIELQDSKGDFR